MTEPGNQDHDGIANAFLIRYLEDLDGDTVRPVEAYQHEFPGYEDLIAGKYAELLGDTETEAPATELFAAELEVGTALSLLDEACRDVGPYTLRHCLGEGAWGRSILLSSASPFGVSSR